MKRTLSIIVLLTCMLTMRAMNPMNPVKGYIIGDKEMTRGMITL